MISVVSALGCYLVYADFIVLNKSDAELLTREKTLLDKDNKLKIKEQAAEKEIVDLNTREDTLTKKDAELTTKEQELNEKEKSLNQLESEIVIKENQLGY